jgi:hypothetical protein
MVNSQSQKCRLLSMPPRPMTAEQRHASLVARFHQNVTPGLPDECWEWQGGRNSRNGRKTYGRLGSGQNGKVYAHRLSVELDGRQVGDKDVLHTCDNPPCCNPRHLVVGTNEDNAQDARAKGLRMKPKCRRGHVRTPGNTYTRTDKNGYVERHCRDCGKGRNGSQPK